MPHHKRLYYIYRNSDDVLVASGTEKQCAEQLGKSISNLRGLISRARSGEIKKWSVEKEVIKCTPVACARCKDYKHGTPGTLAKDGFCNLIKKPTSSICVTTNRLPGCPKEKFMEEYE